MRRWWSGIIIIIISSSSRLGFRGGGLRFRFLFLGLAGCVGRRGGIIRWVGMGRGRGIEMGWVMVRVVKGGVGKGQG
jgi:hypothetical protein